MESLEGGRYVRNGDQSATEREPPSNDMARSLRDAGFPIQRMRTGTPPRIALDSIDFSELQAEYSDDPV